MIDIESELFTEIKKLIIKKFPKAFVTGDYVDKMAVFPVVVFTEIDNSAYRKTQDSSNMENHARLIYEVDIYSNDKRMKKTICKNIAEIIDNKMLNLGFTRLTNAPIPNFEDLSIHRRKLRYRGVVSKDKKVYRG